VRCVIRNVRDPVSLVAGITFLALGVLLILDQSDAIELSFGWIGAALAAVLGAILVASGLSESEDES
jgi:peptidoglycan/LPS O-acetylase OafA/YrhL